MKLEDLKDLPAKDRKDREAEQKSLPLGRYRLKVFNPRTGKVEERWDDPWQDTNRYNPDSHLGGVGE
jgi:hypothetical protein